MLEQTLGGSQLFGSSPESVGEMIVEWRIAANRGLWLWSCQGAPLELRRLRRRPQSQARANAEGNGVPGAWGSYLAG